mgnify:CR=1 FL=1
MMDGPLHGDALERIADALVEHETIDSDEVAEIFKDVPKWEHDESGSMRIRPPEVPLREGISAAHVEPPAPEVRP